MKQTTFKALTALGRYGARIGLVLTVTACAGMAPESGGDVAELGGETARAAPAPDVGGETDRVAASDLEVYRLRAGDVVQISVWNNAELSREVTVAPDGAFQFPFVGEIEAAGRTLPELESVMREQLTPHVVSPQVSASLTELRSYRIYVTGEVTRPGAFDLYGPVSVVQAIAMAGGFTPFASRSDILLYNPVQDGERRRFDYRRFLSDPAAADALLAPGDTLIVR
jgi:polysaccharide export outer membrane protein